MAEETEPDEDEDSEFDDSEEAYGSPPLSYFMDQKRAILEDCGPGEAMSPADFESLKNLHDQEMEATPPRLGFNRELWPIWLAVKGCRMRDGFGVPYEIDWMQAGEVLRNWRGKKTTTDLHEGLLKICHTVMRIESQTREHRKPKKQDVQS